MSEPHSQVFGFNWTMIRMSLKVELWCGTWVLICFTNVQMTCNIHPRLKAIDLKIVKPLWTISKFSEKHLYTVFLCFE